MSSWNYKSKLKNTCPSKNILKSRPNYEGSIKNGTLLQMPDLKISDIKYSNNLYRALETGTIPDNFSWRNQVFKDTKGNIIYKIESGGKRDQASCGCCYSFAIASALGDRYAIKYNINNPFLSTAWILSSYLTGNSYNKCNEGANTKLVSEWLEKDGNGVKRETCWPYDILLESPVPNKYVAPDALNDKSSIPNNCCASCCSDSVENKQQFYCAKNSTNYIVATTNGVFNEDPEATIRLIQKEIMTNGPTVSSYSMYKDFYDYWNDRAGCKNYSDKSVYNKYGDIYIRDITTKDSEGIINGLEADGGHAVVLTGWGIQQDGPQKGIKYWEVRNSWGKGGDDGYCKIAFSSSIPKECWNKIDIPEYKFGFALNGGCISFLPGDLPTETNNYGETNTSSNSNPIGYIDYPPIFAPISLPGIIPDYLKPIVRYIIISIIGIVILTFYYYFFQILFTNNSKFNIILKIFIVLLCLIFAIAYAVLGIQERNFYGLFTYINKYMTYSS